MALCYSIFLGFARLNYKKKYDFSRKSYFSPPPPRHSAGLFCAFLPPIEGVEGTEFLI